MEIEYYVVVGYIRDKLLNIKSNEDDAAISRIVLD